MEVAAPRAGLEGAIYAETIPFNETRSYVRRVFEAETIFHWRMTGEMRRLSDELVALRALPDAPHAGVPG